MEPSGYSPRRKLWTCCRAAEQTFRATQAATTGAPPPPAPAGTNFARSLERARAHMLEVLRDPAVPADSVYASVAPFLGFCQDHTEPAQVMDPLAAAFASMEAPALKTSAATKVIEGVFWVDYAWQARSWRWAKNVSKEGWRLFEERLPKAAAALEEAYKLDPADPHVGETMITVELGQGQGRERMEKWFRRAMDANPDDYAACSNKMGYLEPKWYGSPEAMLEFAHQCVATQSWKADLPFVLPRAYDSLSDYLDDPAPFWKQPEVWTDLQKFYHQAMAAYPGNNAIKSDYAHYAYLAEDWKVADELFQQLGDNPNLPSLFCTKAQYEEMCRNASAQAQKQPSEQ